VNITPHIVVRDADRAAAWYAQALGAEERSRIPLPGGKLMSVELAFGDSTVMVADEFPEAGVLSPLSVGDYLVGREKRRLIRELRQHPDLVLPTLEKVQDALIDFARK